MNVTKQIDEEDESLLTTPNHKSSVKQKKPEKQLKSIERLNTRRARLGKSHTSVADNDPHQLSIAQEGERMLRINQRVEEDRIPIRLREMRVGSEMDFLGYRTIVYVIFLISAVGLIIADYGISDNCVNLKRFDTVFFVTAGCGFSIMMWTILFRSLKPDCFLSSCSCFPLLVVNLMLLAMCIALDAGELFNPVCGKEWARGWLMIYWVSLVFIFPLFPLVLRFINGYYLYWYHLLIMQVIYVTHAMDVWIRGEDNVLPKYIPALTWFFIGSSAWVSTIYLTTYKHIAYLWVVLGFFLVFWAADPVWRLGGPHGLESQILLVVFNLLVTYVLCYRLWEALSPLVRQEGMKLTIDSEDEVEKVRLTLGASIKSLFLRSHLDHRPPIAKSRRKGVWNSGWTLVNNKDYGRGETTVPGRRQTRRHSEDPGAFEVETQILSDYDMSSDNEVRIFIQESDEAPFSPRQAYESVKKLFTSPESNSKSQHQERMECDRLLCQDKATESQQTSVRLLSSILSRKDRESNNSETLPLNQKSVTLPFQRNRIDSTSSQPLLVTSDADEAETRSPEVNRQFEMGKQSNAWVKQTQDQSSFDPDRAPLKAALGQGSGEMAMKEHTNIV